MQARVDRLVTVSDEQILEALRMLWTRCKLAAEPSGAAALAAVTSGAAGLSGRTVACVVSGGNVDAPVISGLFC